MKARLHPRSGAGNIKADASTEEYLIEVKDARYTHTLQAHELNELFRRAAQQGKEARYVIFFSGHNLSAVIHLKRGLQ